MHPGNREGTGPAFDAELEGRLAEAHAAVLAREAARRQASAELPPPKPRADAAWLAAAMTAWLVVILVLLAPPAFLRGAQPRPFAPLASQMESSLRYGIWLARHRVAAFQASEGRLPSFLGEVGVMDTAIILEGTGESTYRLTSDQGDRALIYESSMSVDSFLGRSLELLRAPP
jgi:hypothetical protein